MLIQDLNVFQVLARPGILKAHVESKVFLLPVRLLMLLLVTETEVHLLAKLMMRCLLLLLDHLVKRLLNQGKLIAVGVYDTNRLDAFMGLFSWLLRLWHHDHLWVVLLLREI